MANTTNLDLNKLAGTEKLKTFPTPYNDNMDAIDAAFGAGFGLSGNPNVNASINNLGDGLAILANGNTHAAITSGWFVYIRNHASLSEGLYRATANIAANGTLSGNNVLADSNGGLNTVYSELNSKITSQEGGVPVRSVGVLANNASLILPLSNAYSIQNDFALVSFNVAGNSIAGCALLFLGKGSSKIKDLIGSMNAEYYTASYSNYTWTITNKSGSDLYYTIITSKV